jgi:hypothetical protein
MNPKVQELNYLPEVVDFDTVKDLSAIKFFTHERHSKLIELGIILCSFK